MEILKAGTLSHILHQLTANTFYKVEIRAHNILGWGEPSHIIVKTAPPSGKASDSDINTCLNY